MSVCNRQGKEQLPIASKGEDFFGLTHSLVQTLLHKLKSVSQPTSTATVSKTSSTDPCVSWEAYRARCKYITCLCFLSICLARWLNYKYSFSMYCWIMLVNCFVLF